MAAYYTIPGLEQTYLEDSFVLSVQATPGSIELELEIVLREGHADYSPPIAGQQYCYKRGRVRFVRVREVRWRMEGVQVSRDASDEADYGGVDNFEVTDEGFALSGDFGALEIVGGECQIEFENGA